MIYYKTKEEVELIRESCLLVCEALSLVGSMIRPGMTGKQIDKEAETLIRDNNAVPGFKGYNGFPATLCISVNEQVVHGIPSEIPFKDGDIVSVDCGVFKNDFFGDSAFTFPLGDVKEEVMELCRKTNNSLYMAIEKAIAGNRLGDVGYAVQNFMERENGYGVVRELVGHGIGRDLHEAPEVPNYGRRGSGTLLKDGLVIAIEPMVNLGKRHVMQAKDGWTVITKDKKPSAHYEHTVVVRKDKADVLSNHEMVMAAVKNNPEVKDISIKS